MRYSNRTLPVEGMAPGDVTYLFAAGKPVVVVAYPAVVLWPNKPTGLDPTALYQEARKLKLPPKIDPEVLLRTMVQGPLTFSRYTLLATGVPVGRIEKTLHGWVLHVFGRETHRLGYHLETAEQAKAAALALPREVLL